MRRETCTATILPDALWLAFAVAGLLIACDDTEDDTGSTAPSAAPVVAARAEERALERTVSAIGSILAKQAVVVRAEATGSVQRIAFEEGQEVEANQLLFVLEGDKLANRARAENAARLRERFESRHTTGAVSAIEFEKRRTQAITSRADVQRLRAELARTRYMLADTRVHAPFAGLTSEHDLELGQFVTAGQALVTVYGRGALKIRFSLPESDARRAELGQVVTAALVGEDSRTITGEPGFIIPNVAAASRDVAFEARLVSGAHPSDTTVKPGAFANLTLLVVPVGYLVLDQDRLKRRLGFSRAQKGSTPQVLNSERSS